MDDGSLTDVVIGLAALGAGALGGFFLAFSTIVMSALRRQPERAGLEAMQAINVDAERSVGLLGTLFVATAAGAVVLVVALRDLGGPGAPWLLVGALLHLVGSFGVTAAFHVPRNQALGRLDPAAPGSAEAWRTYARTWTAGNHVRAAAGVLAAAALVLGLLARAG